MNQPSKQNDPINLPEVQDIIMSGMIGCIAVEASKMLDITPTDALMEFYESDTCKRLHDKTTGLYLFSEKYIAEDFVNELTNKSTNRFFLTNNSLTTNQKSDASPQ